MAQSHSTPWQLTPARIAAIERSRRTNPHRIEGNSAYILLTGRKGEPMGEAIVDVEDVERVLAFGSWHRQDVVWPQGTMSYAMASIRRDSPLFVKRGQQLYMHRFILSPADDELVDHWNGNGLDNRKENLRIASSSENGLNRLWHRRIAILEETLRELRDCRCGHFWCEHRKRANVALGE